MGKMWGKALALVVVGSVVGCSQGTKNNSRYGIDPSPDKMAAMGIDESFKVDKNQITILKSALDKEFLFQAELIDLKAAVQFSGVKSRVVSFVKKGDKVFMLESKVGHVVNNDYDIQLPLAQFEITAESDTTLTLDFNKALSRLYVGDDWTGQDFDGGEYDPSQRSLRVDISYLDDVHMDADQNLVIKQIANVAGSPTTAQQTLSIEMRYYITPYHPNTSFQPKESFRFKRFGYFETNPVLKLGGESVAHAVKRDINKPIVYAISDTTPPEYREAVKTGILYWNQMLGENKIQVVDAPKGVNAPDFNYNIIQWIDWSEAGFAYADDQVDPRSGEVLHSQVFMTSSFALHSKNEARSFLRRLKDSKKSQQAKMKLKGFDNNEACEIGSEKALENYLEKVTELDVSDEQIFNMSKDYISMIVAHEVGHTLGLRHNFAGSLAMSISPADQDAAFGEYLKTGSVPESYIPTSSVMDYMSADIESMLGARMREKLSPLAYDLKAMEHLYFNKNFENKDVPLFCTDSHVGDYIDCQRFDQGASPVEYVQVAVKQSLEEVPAKLLERLITWKVEWSKQEYDILTALPNPKFAAMMILDPQSELQNMLKKDFKLLQIERKYPEATALNREEILKAQDDYLEAEFKRLGGVEKVLEPFLQSKPEFVKDMIVKLNTLIESKKYSHGLGPKEKPFELSDKELEFVRSHAQVYFEKLFDELKKSQLKDFPNFLTEARDASVMAQEVADFFGNEQKRIVLSQNPKPILAEFIGTSEVTVQKDKDGKITKVGIDDKTGSSYKLKMKPTLTALLPNFTYDLETRLLAAGLFDMDKNEDAALGVREQEEVKTLYANLMTKTLMNLENFEIKKEDQNRDALRWFLEKDKVKSALDAASKTDEEKENLRHKDKI